MKTYIHKALAVGVALGLALTIAVYAGPVLQEYAAEAERGGQINIRVNSGTETMTGGGNTQDVAAAIPAGAIVLGVTCYVDTVVTGCTTWSVGSVADADRWGTGMVVAATTTSTSDDFAADCVPLSFPAASALRFTAIGGGAVWTTGVIYWEVTYFEIDAPRAT